MSQPGSESPAGRNRGAHPLDHSQAIGERAVALGPLGERQRHVRGGGDGVAVRADDHQGLELVEGQRRGRVGGDHAVRADDQERRHRARLEVVGEIEQRAQPPRADGHRAGGVGVLVGAHQDVVAPALIETGEVRLAERPGDRR